MAAFRPAVPPQVAWHKYRGGFLHKKPHVRKHETHAIVACNRSAETPWPTSRRPLRSRSCSSRTRRRLHCRRSSNPNRRASEGVTFTSFMFNDPPRLQNLHVDTPHTRVRQTTSESGLQVRRLAEITRSVMLWQPWSKALCHGNYRPSRRDNPPHAQDSICKHKSFECRRRDAKPKASDAAIYVSQFAPPIALGGLTEQVHESSCTLGLCKKHRALRSLENETYVRAPGASYV